MNTNTKSSAVSANAIADVDFAPTEIESLSLHELEFVAGGSGCDNLGKI